MIDVLIIGQGIAGSILSAELIRQGLTVQLIDNKHHLSSTKVAAGIINPITGQRFAKSWMIDTLIPEAEETYRHVESFLEKQYFFPRHVYRFITSIKQQNDWDIKKDEQGLAQFISSSAPTQDWNKILKQDFIENITFDGWQLNTADFLADYRSYLSKENIILNDKFNYKELNINSSSIQYKGIEAKNIVFCEGFQYKHNPFFPDIKVNSTLGEFLVIDCPELPQHLVKYKQMFAPLSDGTFWVGATFKPEFDYLSESLTSEKTYTSLSKKIDDILNVPYKILLHKGGVRPTVSDRRPIIGASSLHPNIHLFNGFGAKGIALAPYFAKEFVRHLTDGTDMNSEVRIDRF